MTGTENILAADGYNLALTGMLIVFAALALITVAISMFPRILKVVNRAWPEPQARALARPAPASEDVAPMIAAIGYALHRTGARK